MAVALAGGVLLGCGATRKVPPMRSDGGTDGANGGSLVDSNGTYHHGVYTCCGPDAGLTCCTADAGLLGYAIEPDGAIVKYGGLPVGSIEPTQANCFRYGGDVGACTGVGFLYDGKDACALCCPGLTRVNPMAPTDGGGACAESSAPSAFTCVPCGNGVCEPSENRCTCPADCP
jgi:hypothetical protein